MSGPACLKGGLCNQAFEQPGPETVPEGYYS